MANTYLTRTTGSPSNADKMTFSAWIKSTRLGASESLIAEYTDASNRAKLQIKSTGTLEYFQLDSGVTTSQLRTNRLFRDVNAWYHVVFQYDSSQSTSSDRLKLYINGVQETSFEIATYPSQNQDTRLNKSGVTLNIGQQGDNNNYFDGLMSHVHFIDGTAYDASAFGSTDSTTGEWKINTSPSVTYGTNGFFVLKDGNSVTDQSGNGNNFTVAGGTLTNTEDCPSNVFCTINSLDNYYNGQQSGSISHGNTKIQTGGSGIESYTTSTLGASSGKFYCEMKLVSSTSVHKTRFGIAYEPTNATSDWLGKRNVGWSYIQSGDVTNNNASVGGTWSSYTAGDIIGMAFNLDDLQGGLHKLYFSKNGVWQNGADPSNYSSTTGVVGITADKTYLIAIGDETGGYSVCELNFGNGYFGTTAVSSAGTNASGIGIFEYDVPTGFTALSTKGLNL